MSKIRIAAVISATILLAGLSLNSAMAQDTEDRTVEQYLCKDVMRESGANRDVAIAFLHGFLLGKSGSSKLNLNVMHKQTDDFTEFCLSHPDDKAIGAMSMVKK